MRWLDGEKFRHIEEEGTTAFRVADGGGSSVDRFATTALVSAGREEDVRRIAADVPAFAVRTGWSVRRILGRTRVHAPGAEDVPFALDGNAVADPREEVRESGLVFEVDFSQSYSPGLFCDQRANRRILRKLAPARVLNTFAYTCAFSVAAAAAGAVTTSVDVSKASLQRGRRNFELNGLELDGHRFVAEDTRTYMERLARRGETFDAIILDPPTFGRGGGKKTFRIERDFPDLMRLAASLAAPGAVVLLSCNFSGWQGADLRGMAKDVLPRGTRFAPEGEQADFLPGSGSVTVWAHLP